MQYTNDEMLNKNRGFTIVELLIVIVVISVLAVVTVVAFNGVSQRAADAVIKSDLTTAARLLANELTTTGAYPTTTSSLPSTTTYNYTYSNSGTPSYSLTGTKSGTSNSYQITHLNSSPTLVTGAPPVVTIPASNTTSYTDGCGGGFYDVGLYSTATGSPTPTIQWQRLTTKNTTSGTWTNISGGTTGFYNFNASGILIDGDYMMFRAIWTSGAFTTTTPTIQYYLTNGC